MTDRLIQQAEQVFRAVFRNPAIVIRQEYTAGDIPGWDSLTHMTLIASLEEAFSIRFSFEEVSRFKNIGDMLQCISAKIS